MLIGQTIVCDPDSADTVVYTPAFPRQGNGITSAAEVFRMPDDTTLTIQLQHTNSEDMEKSSGSGGWSDVSGASITFNSEVKWVSGQAGGQVKDSEGSDLKEVLRYKITLGTTDTQVKSYAHFRVLNPSWQTSGAQSI